nr:MAG TPA: hypothetical protein [Caudoviricetes sp.]
MILSENFKLSFRTKRIFSRDKTRLFLCNISTYCLAF